MHRRAALPTAAGLGCVIALGIFAACTSNDGGSSSTADLQAGASAPSAAASRAAAGGAAGAYSSAGSAAGAAAPATAKSAAGADTAVDIALGKAEIRTATITVAVKHGGSVAAQANAADAIALGAGGEIDADNRTTGAAASASLVLRVPPEQLSPVLSALSKLGAEKGRSLSVVDVTGKVADVSSRVTSARTSITRLRSLYAHATKIADVITIEGELADRESDLESLEAQQRSLADETTTASITLTLTSAPATLVKAPVKHHDRSGFTGGLANGWHAFGTGAAAIATAVGALLPFLVLVLVLAVIGRLAWLRLRPTQRNPEPLPPAA